MANPELRERGEFHLHAELIIYRAGTQLFSKHCTRILGHKSGADCTAPQSSWDIMAASWALATQTDDNLDHQGRPSSDSNDTAAASASDTHLDDTHDHRGRPASDSNDTVDLHALLSSADDLRTLTPGPYNPAFQILQRGSWVVVVPLLLCMARRSRKCARVIIIDSRPS